MTELFKRHKMQKAKRKHIPIYLAKVAQYLCQKMALKEE